MTDLPDLQKNRTAPTWCGSSLFIAPSERTADGDRREENHRGGSLDLHVRRVANPKRGSRGMVVEPEHYGRVSNAGRIGRKEEARHGRDDSSKPPSGSYHRHPARHTIRLYTDAV
ncbi:hypothetical protein [uncultured Muribaculum sp.]|uniref:hypothetical protein n=1 Tax=uncultured Muribaculum sp. TaxID=1918613 RepID=UPI002731B2F4|nr:hypothetical protein [uncultured Muribaculum sp.]